MPMRVAISGAGIAGSALAHWLLRAGHEPTLIEAAPTFRAGGYVIDFRGLGYTLAERMGILPKVLEAGYAQRELRFVDDRSRKVGGFSTKVIHEAAGGRFTTVSRGELATLLYQTVEGQVETIFGNSITSIEEHADGVRITLLEGQRRDFDVVVGADGLHSNVRRLVFGSDNVFERDLGYRVAVIEANGYRPRDELVYVIHASPSRQIARFALRGDRTLFLFVFRRALMRDPEPTDDAERRELLRFVYGDTGWEAPQILELVDAAEHIYFDRVSQIRTDTWHKGRVVLAGDAGAAVSLLAGEGTGLAMTEAYVLAGELHRANGDYQTAFREYENRLRSFITGKQEAAKGFAATFIPKTGLGTWARNVGTGLMNVPGLGGLLLGRMLRDDLELPNYFA